VTAEQKERVEILIDEALAWVWMDGVNPNEARDALMKNLKPFLK
jgi:hypothetical protein